MSLIVANSYNENDTTKVRDYSISLADSTPTGLTLTSDTFGYYANFNGTSTNYDLTGLSFASEFTLFFEININSFAFAPEIIYKLNCFNIKLDTNSLSFVIDDGTTTHSAAVTVSTGTWYKIACTYSNTNGMNVYVDNGIVASSNANTLTLTATGTVKVGSNGSRYFNGKLREFRIYDNEITADGISSLMKSQQGIDVAILEENFNVGDLISQKDDYGLEHRSVVFATNTREVRVLPMNERPIKQNLKIMRIGHRWDTSRQHYFVISGTATFPEITYFENVNLHSDIDTSTKKVTVINKNGIFKKGATKTANYTALDYDSTIYVDTTTGNITITLPTTPLTEKVYTIFKTTSDSNTVTIAGNGKTINGSTSATLSSQYSFKEIIYNGTIWIEK